MNDRGATANWNWSSASSIRTTLLLLLCIAATFNVIALARPFVTTDEGVFLVIGRDLGRGMLPYRDYWDHKPPGIYALTYALTRLPLPLWALRVVFGGICLAVLCITAGVLGMWKPGQRMIVVTSVLAFGLSPAVQANRILTEHGEAMFLLMAVSAAILAQRSTHRWGLYGWAFFSGMMIAIAVFFRPQAVIYSVVLLTLPMLIPDNKQAGNYRGLFTGISIVAGGISVATLILYVLHINDILIPFWDQAVWANVRISTDYVTWGARIANLSTLARQVSLLGAPLLLAVVAIVRTADSKKAWMRVWAVLLLLALVEALIPGKGFPHYLIVFAYLLSLVATEGVIHICRTRVSESAVPISAVALLLSLLVVGASFQDGPLTMACALRGSTPKVVLQRKLVELRHFLGPSDTVWAGGTYGADLYWCTQTPSASRYFYTEGGAKRSHSVDSRELLRDLRLRKPRIILVGPLWLSDRQALNDRIPTDLRGFIEEDYRRMPWDLRDHALFMRCCLVD